MRSRAIFPLLALAGLVVAFAPRPAQLVAPVERVFQIEASQYAYDPGEISVNPGDTVTIELVATDVVHGLYVDGYGVSIKADPGQTASLTFIANKAGSFRLRCNVTCGAMHPFMIGKLNVGMNTWLYRSIGLAFIGVLSSFVFIRATKVER
jgi:heme/copper-type cytochrome/quinol oxidase subunit 2